MVIEIACVNPCFPASDKYLEYLTLTQTYFNMQ